MEDYENRGHFYPRVWRRETFRLSPTFPLKKDSLREYWDEELLIVDITKEWETIRGKTVEDVLEKVVGEIEKTFRKERRE